MAYFDSQNNIIGTGFAFTVPSSLTPMQAASYEVMTSVDNLASSDVAITKVTYLYEMAGVSHNALSPSDSVIPSEIGGTKASCDKVVLRTLTLTENLKCTGDGLIVGGNNIVINLNNHSITGPGENSSKVGIAVPGDENVILSGPGYIRNFQAGILVSASAGTKIDNVTFEGNKIAIFQTGSTGTTVSENILSQNTIGVASHSSTNAHILNNAIIDNDLAGITIVNTDTSMIEANTINGSRNGIFLDAQTTGTIVTNNIAIMNNIDLNNADGLPLNINGNEFNNNQCNISQPIDNCN